MVTDRELNQAISRAKSNVAKKLERIRKRENFSDAVIRIIDPRRNQYVPDMSRGEKESFLSALRNFTSKNVNYYRDAHGNPITADQWRAYKDAENRANAFVRADIRKYGKLKGPIGDLTIAERQERLRPKPGVLIANPSGSGMFEIKRKPNEVVGASLDTLMASLERRLEPGYKPQKSFEGRDQFEKMITAIGDDELRQQARNLNDDQFWALWNYTDFARNVSLDYLMVMEGMKSGLSKDAQLTISQSSRSQAHRYVEWASRI